MSTTAAPGRTRPRGAREGAHGERIGDAASAAGATHRTSTDELVPLIRSLGRTPAQRDTLYRNVRVGN